MAEQTPSHDAVKFLREAFQRAKEAAHATMPFWRSLSREARQIISATAQQSGRISQYIAALWREHSFARAALQAKQALGQRLAESVLADTNPPPEAEPEYSAAKSALLVLATHQAKVAAARSTILPSTGAEIRRVAIGYGLLTFLAILVITLVVFRPRAPERFTEADHQKEREETRSASTTETPTPLSSPEEVVPPEDGGSDSVAIPAGKEVTSLPPEQKQTAKERGSDSVAIPAGKEVTSLPLTGEETSLVRIKANPANYLGREFTLCGSVSIEDYYSFGYERAKNTHYSLRFTERDENAKQRGVCFLYVRRSLGAALVESIVQSQEATGLEKALRVRATLDAARFVDGKYWGNIEVLDWQFLAKGRKTWAPWAIEPKDKGK